MTSFIVERLITVCCVATDTASCSPPNAQSASPEVQVYESLSRITPGVEENVDELKKPFVHFALHAP